jgi:hypothetical protein
MWCPERDQVAWQYPALRPGAVAGQWCFLLSLFYICNSYVLTTANITQLFQQHETDISKKAKKLCIMKESTVNQRFEKIVEHFAKGNKSAFAKSIDVSSQGLGEILGGRQSAPSFALLQKLFASYPQVRMSWLIMGEGEMIEQPPSAKENMAALQEIQDSISVAEKDYQRNFRRLQLALKEKRESQEKLDSLRAESQEPVDVEIYKELLAAYEIGHKHLNDFVLLLAENAKAARMQLANLHLQLGAQMKNGNFNIDEITDSIPESLK